MSEVGRKRFALVGWQRAALVVLAVANLWSCRVAYGDGHLVWAVSHAAMAALLFTFLVVTWPEKRRE